MNDYLVKVNDLSKPYDGVNEGYDGLLYDQKIAMIPDVTRKKEGFSGQKAIVLPRKVLSERCAKNDIIGTLYITDIGYYPKARHHYRERNTGAEQHILIYCHKGYGSMVLNKKRLEIEPGDFFIISAKKPHVYMADEKNPWSIYWLHFKGTVAAQIVAVIEKTIGSKGFLKHSEQTISLFKEMYAQLERGYGRDNLMYANMCLWHFLTSIMYNEKYAPPGDREVKDELNVAIDFMKKNISEVLTVEKIAAAANLSVSHFTYLFKNKTGFTPIEYFNHLKIQQACQYLLFTELRVKEISYELGIDDPYYFTRMFTKVMGMSPNTYREKRIH
ncbi:AraC family transcriptional regulator [Agriterribacter sp.]|uniref:AraC family transcriptional regulator n=1 Tax=Agriterribacter sp. TaxID=2821509 RepID=UPI002C51F3DD|nr:AraC family transcriptional regulator [Agriterribacter sp.]HRP57392.1 AraC family transcriptional regulator [Agriterribacter sp.]